jgi:hypothetical protein
MTAIAVPSSDIDCAGSADGPPLGVELPETSLGLAWIVVCEGVGLLSIPLSPPDELFRKP